MLFGHYSYGAHAEDDKKAMQLLFKEHLYAHGMFCAYAAIGGFLMEHINHKFNQRVAVFQYPDLLSLAETSNYKLTQDEKELMLMLMKYRYVLCTPSIDDDDLVQFTSQQAQAVEELVSSIRLYVTRECLRTDLRERAGSIEKMEMK